MSEPTLKLPQGAEALLSDFPLVEPDFEAQAKAIEARLQLAKLPIDDLLGAPALAPEVGEPHAPSSARAASAPKGTFAEMARKSVQKKEDDSAQLAKELLAVTAQNRRPNAELVERVRRAGRPSATSTPLPVESASEDPPRPSGVVTRAVAPVAPAATTEPPAKVAAPAAAQPDRVPTEALPKAAADAKPDDVLRPEALAQQASEAEAREPSKAPLPKLAGGGAAAPASAPKASAAPSAGAQAPMAVVLEEDPEPLKPAVGETKPKEPEPQLQPAEGSRGGVPLTPSAGAISTALGSVRGSAQACLAGQSEPVTATVTFASDGRVLRVSAAGPSGACIQAALAKARIAPFARESFSAPTTIRPP